METEENISAKSVQDSACQTDENLIYNYAWSKYYQHFINYYNSSNQINQAQNQTNEKSEPEENLEKLDAESIKKIAQDSLDSRGFLFDLQTGLYYDSQNALYYDQNKKLYFDNENGIYYHYVLNKNTNTFHLRFHSKIGKKEWKRLCKINHEKNDSKSIEDLDSCDEDDSMDSEESNENLCSKYPPCIRAILIDQEEDSSSYDLGSLFIIPYTGGSIGSSTKNLINFKDGQGIDKIHLTVSFDSNKKCYLIKDENSSTGTYLNNVRIVGDTAIKHGDKLRIGNKIALLLHIHEGTNTCINCEPGEVIHRLKLEKESKSLCLEKNKEELRRENVKLIKKKYGIRGEEEVKLDSKEYFDRAEHRRKEQGVDWSHLETLKEQEASAKSDKKIEQTNIGLKMLSKMGWKEGKGLGKTESGIREPIQSKLKFDKSGLGSQTIECNIDIDEKQKRKIINWNKAKNRFKNIQENPKLSSVFNDDDDDDDNN